LIALLLVSTVQDGVLEGMRRNPLRVLAGTWNVATVRPATASIQEWLGERSQDADIVCLGLQV
jgi:hypothetical protein